MKNPSFLDDAQSMSYEDASGWLIEEAILFAQLVRSNTLRDVIGCFFREQNERKPLSSCIAKPPSSVIKVAVLNLSKPSDWLMQVLAVAQVAVFSNLFQGCTLKLDKFTEESARRLAEYALQQFRIESGDGKLNILTIKLDMADAIRVVYILRAGGFLDLDPENIHQLSLGPDGGTRDITATHEDIWLEKTSLNPIPVSNTAADAITLHAHTRHVKHAILLDCAESLKERYEEINRQTDDKLWGNHVFALNTDIEEGLKKISAGCTAGSFAPRNLVLAYRIDHRMLPDVAGFFRNLSSVIDNTADLVVTIGAGNTAEEFSGRLNKMEELGDYLQSAGLTPKRIRLFSCDTPDLQRNHPLFGRVEHSSYEILHCRLQKEKLQKD